MESNDSVLKLFFLLLSLDIIIVILIWSVSRERTICKIVLKVSHDVSLTWAPKMKMTFKQQWREFDSIWF